YSGVFLYSARSLWNLSFMACACDSNGSFSACERLCQFSPTSFAISVKVKLRPLSSSRISLQIGWRLAACLQRSTAGRMTYYWRKEHRPRGGVREHFRPASHGTTINL